MEEGWSAGEVWRNEQVRPSVPEIPGGSTAAVYDNRTQWLQALMP